MALAATIVWECQTGGSDLNGGGYKSDAGTTDYSQQAAAQLSLADGATSGIGVTTLTSATGGFTAAMVGNVLYLASGTNATVGYYEITAYTDTNTVTLDRAPDDGVGGILGDGALKVGGALASPGMAVGAVSVDGHSIYIKAGTYVLTTSSTNVSGGIIVDNNFRYTLEGYQTNRGDLGTKPIIQVPGGGGITSVIVMDFVAHGTGDNIVCRNIEVDGNSQAGITGFKGALYVTVENCKASNCVVGFTAVSFSRCEADTCTTGFQTFFKTYLCSAHDGTIGFDPNTNQGTLMGCAAYGNSSSGFKLDNNSILACDCVADQNTADGFLATGQNLLFINCAATANGGYGWNATANRHLYLLNCADYNNTSGRTDGTEAYDIDGVTCTGDPWTNSATADYRPNDTAGRGAALRAVGVGPVTQTNAIDIGAVQHADPAGGGGMFRRVPITIGAGR